MPALNTEKMSVNEIRTMLINDYNLPEDKINETKGKTNLVNLLLSMENNLDNNEFTITGFNEGFNQTETFNRFSKGWTQFILNQLEDDEKDQQYPKTCGLGRLLEKEVSKIISLTSSVIQPPRNDNNMMATVKTTLELENGEVYEACADAQKSSLEYPYDKHVTAIAETRSEGRVYRRALRLKGVVTQEEMIEKKEEKQDKINKNQIMLIDNLCMNDRLNINVKNLLQSLFKDDYKINIQDYSHEQGAIINRKLTEYQSDTGKIPTELRGYSPDWK
jgi:hypothetical protein